MAQLYHRTFWDRLGITLVVLAVYRLGTNVPLPGLEADKLAPLVQTIGATQRVSIFALGIMPLLNALILVELLKLVAPDIRRWEFAAAGNRDRMTRIVIALALLFALLQGAGIASALEDVTGLVAEPGFAFWTACTATLIAGAALAIAFAAIIDRSGLGDGIWLLFLTPAVAEIPRTLAALAILNANGDYDTEAFAISAAVSALAIAGVVNLILAGRATAAVAATCVWTPIIASAVVGPVLFIPWLLITWSIDAASKATAPGQLPWCVAMVIVVALAVWLYARSYERAGEQISVPASAIAATLAPILVAGPLLEAQFGVLLPLSSAQLVIAATVATRLLVGWGRTGAGNARPKPTRPTSLRSGTASADSVGPLVS